MSVTETSWCGRDDLEIQAADQVKDIFVDTGANQSATDVIDPLGSQTLPVLSSGRSGRVGDGPDAVLDGAR